MQRSTRVAAFAALFAGTLTTTAFATADPFGTPYTMPLRPGDGSESVGRLIAGQFAGDVTPDIAVCRPGEPPILFVAPDRFSAPLELPASATTTDIAVIRDTNGFDQLVTAGPDGLRTWIRNSDLGVFAMSDPGGSAAWSSVTRLASGDLIGGAATDIVGYDAVNQSILVLEDVGTPGMTEWSFDLPDAALDIVPFVRSGSGTVQLAIPTSIGLFIYDVDCNDDLPEASFPHAGHSTVTPLRRAAVPHDSLAWIHSGTGGDDLELIVNTGSTLFSYATIGLPVTGTRTLTSADVDENGTDDLILGHATGTSVHVLLNSGGTYDPTDPDSWHALALGAAAAGATDARPVTADLDGDGDLEVAHVSTDDDTLAIASNTLVDAAGQTPVRGDETLSAVMHYGWLTGSPTYLRYDFDLAEGPAPAGATHIELMVWRKADATSAVDADGTRYLIPLADVGDPFYVDLQESTQYSDAIYLTAYRFVDIPAAGNPDAIVARAFPSGLHCFTAGTPWAPLPGSSAEWVQQHPYGTAWRGVVPDPLLGVNPEPDDTTTENDTRPLPDFDDDDEPGNDDGTGGDGSGGTGSGGGT